MYCPLYLKKKNMNKPLVNAFPKIDLNIQVQYDKTHLKWPAIPMF